MSLFRRMGRPRPARPAGDPPQPGTPAVPPAPQQQDFPPYSYPDLGFMAGGTDPEWDPCGRGPVKSTGSAS